ncbi:hypothetical protein ACVNF4_21725, partial [Streptomyces sp. S6]
MNPTDADRFPHEPADRLVVHEGQFHRVVIGADHVLCRARTEAAARRLPARVDEEDGGQQEHGLRPADHDLGPGVPQGRPDGRDV